MAPSTPPPPRSEAFAALTMASTSCLVMSPSTATMRFGFMRQLKPGGLGSVESRVVAEASELDFWLAFSRRPETLAPWYGFRSGAIGVVLRFSGLAATQPQAGAHRHGGRFRGRGGRFGHDLHRKPEGSQRQRGAVRNPRAQDRKSVV